MGQFPAPLVSYLAYYQALEYYLPIYSEERLMRRLRNVLKDPRFHPDDDVAVGRLVTLAGAGRQASELERLKSTIEACVEDDELREFLLRSQEMLDFFSDKGNIPGVRALHLQDKQVSLSAQVADRVYDLRCRIVHSKESDGAARTAAPLLPFSPEASRLAHDIDLIRFLARKVLVALGKPFTLR